MGEEKTYAEVVTLIEPERQPTTRISQYSIVTKAMEYQSLLERYDEMKKELSDAGLRFGGRVLLIGPTGTDFEAFSHYLCREVPLKMIRYKMEELLKDREHETTLFKIGFEFARRNSPALLLVEHLETLAPIDSDSSAVFYEELGRISWDNDEIQIVASTTNPQEIDAEVLAQFDRAYVLKIQRLRIEFECLSKS